MKKLSAKYTRFIRILLSPQAAGDDIPVTWIDYDHTGTVIGSSGANAVSITALPPFSTKGKQGNLETIVLIPGQDVTILETTLTPAQLAASGPALAYAIEPELAVAPEDVYAFAFPASAASARVAVISRPLLDAVSNTLTKCNIHPTLTTSEALLLPENAHHLTLIDDGDKVIFRYGQGSAQALESATFAAYFAVVTETWHSADIYLRNTSARANYETVLAGKVTDIRWHELPQGDALAVLSSAWLSAGKPALVNLQDAASLGRWLQKFHFQDMRRLGAALLASLMLVFVFNIVAGNVLGVLAERQRVQNEARYAELFPGASPSLMETKVSHGLKQVQRSGNAGFTAMMHSFTTSYAQSGVLDVLRVERITYAADVPSLTLDITVSEAGITDSLTRVPAPPGFTFEVGSLVQNQDQVKGTIILKGKSQ